MYDNLVPIVVFTDRCCCCSFCSKRDLRYVCYMLSLVCLSVVCRLWRSCTLLRRLKFSAFLTPYDSSWTLVFWCQNPLVGDAPFPEICVQSDPPPFQTAQFRRISAHSASTVIASEKSLISTYRKSTTFQRAIDEPCTLPLSPPKCGTKTRYRCLCQ